MPSHLITIGDHGQATNLAQKRLCARVHESSASATETLRSSQVDKGQSLRAKYLFREVLLLRSCSLRIRSRPTVLCRAPNTMNPISFSSFSLRLAKLPPRGVALSRSCPLAGLRPKPSAVVADGLREAFALYSLRICVRCFSSFSKFISAAARHVAWRMQPPNRRAPRSRPRIPPPGKNP
jgi:hypothetical protein